MIGQHGLPELQAAGTRPLAQRQSQHQTQGANRGGLNF
jgi:hypothetical protein